MAKTEQDSKPKKPVQNILGAVALVVSLIAIASLLSYDIWGEKWLKIAGRNDNSARPHQHEEIANFTSQSLNAQSRLQALESIVESLQSQQRKNSDSQTEFLSTLESLQSTLTEQNNIASTQQESLQSLQGNYEALWQQISENPQTLSIIIAMISERRKVGLPLEQIPYLIQHSGLPDIADKLRIFETDIIPTDEALLQAYESLRPEIALALGGVIELPQQRNFIDGAIGYAKSLVRIRKLGENLTEPSDFENLSHAIEARNFTAVYEFAKNIDSDSKDIAEWLDKLQLRHQADEALLALHDDLLNKMLQQLESTGAVQ